MATEAWLLEKATIGEGDEVANSLADRILDLQEEVSEIERHLHSGGSWFETASVPSGETHVADRIGSGAGAFQGDAGNDDWGAWVQVVGSSDTPARTGMLYFDPHLISIEAAERNGTYFLQFARGDSGAAGLAAGHYTELVIDTTKVGGHPVPVQTGRAPAGSKLWFRCMFPGQNTATIDFFLGLHEYSE